MCVYKYAYVQKSYKTGLQDLYFCALWGGGGGGEEGGRGVFVFSSKIDLSLLHVWRRWVRELMCYICNRMCQKGRRFLFERQTREEVIISD
jgi:hypothetical protein